jgi:type IV secretion system protein TrbF
MKLTDYISKKNNTPLQNPYVKGAEGRAEWNDRYMNLAKSVRNWQLAFAVVSLIALILVLTVMKMAGESQVKPFVVETNQGLPYAIRPVKGISGNDQRIINYAINQFIINSRTIISDVTAEKALLSKVLAYSADDTLKFMRDYYNQNSPFALAREFTVEVNIVNAMSLSKNTWQISWDETKRANGNVVGVSRWEADVTYKFGEVNPKFINDNPFGIYITNLSWAQSNQ